MNMNMNFAVPTIVLDVGAGCTKVGISGLNAAPLSFPTVVSRTRRPMFPHRSNSSSLVQTLEREIFVGAEALQRGRSKNADMSFPIVAVNRGIHMNWDDMEAIWCYSFYEVLKVNPEEYPVLLTDAPLSPKSNRERMAQIMFETFNIPELCITSAPLLAMLYGSDRSLTGCVLDSGEYMTRAIPIFEGCIVPHAVVCIELGGKHVTENLMELLNNGPYPLENFLKKCCVHPSETAGGERIRSVKEKLCYVALNFEREKMMPVRTKFLDGFSLGRAQFECPEVLFNPSWFLQSDLGCPLQKPIGVHECVERAIHKCHEDIHQDLFSNVVLSGGNAMFKGFKERMEKELASCNRVVNVVQPSNASEAAWIGGSKFSLMAVYCHMWITKAEYFDTRFSA